MLNLQKQQWTTVQKYLFIVKIFLKSNFSEIEKEQKKVEKIKEKLREGEDKNAKLSVMLRTMLREILMEVEKLRARASAHRKVTGKQEEVDKKFYAESLDILGIEAEEMGEFVQHKKSASSQEQINQDLLALAEKINKIVENKEEQNDYSDVIEQFKTLLKEKSGLEKFISSVEEKENPCPSSVERYEKYTKNIENK